MKQASADISFAPRAAVADYGTPRLELVQEAFPILIILLRPPLIGVEFRLGNPVEMTVDADADQRKYKKQDETEAPPANMPAPA